MSGTFIDGSPVYPGILNLTQNGGLRPARVSNKTSFSPILEFNQEKSDKTSSQFFFAHSHLIWAVTNTLEAFKIPGVIKLQEKENFATVVARFNFTHGNQTFQQIGIYENKTSNAYYWNGEKVVEHKGIFEVLTCSQCQNGGSGERKIFLNFLLNLYLQEFFVV